MASHLNFCDVVCSGLRQAGGLTSGSGVDIDGATIAVIISTNSGIVYGSGTRDMEERSDFFILILILPRSCHLCHHAVMSPCSIPVSYVLFMPNY